MEQSPGYREGVDDSIRRCEELLALPPLALETSASGLRRSFSDKERSADTSRGCFAKVEGEEVSDFSSQELWKRNMDLLVNGTTKLQESSGCKSDLEPSVDKAEDQCVFRFTPEPQGVHESAERNSESLLESSASAGHGSYVHGTGSFEESSAKSPSGCPKSSASSGNNYSLESECSAASLEWVINGSCQDSSRLSQKSVTNHENCDRLHVVLPLDNLSATQSIVSETRSNECRNAGTKARSHAIEVTATTILDSNEGGLSSRTSPCIAESDFKEDDSFVYGKHSHRSSLDCLHSENDKMQASTPDSSGVSRLALGVTWGSSDRFTSSESERINLAGFSGSGKPAEHMYISQKVNKTQRHKRSKGVAKERCEDRLQTLARPRTEVYRKLAELKALLEREKLQQCSFKPKVGRKPDPESMHSAPIIERILELQQRFGLRKRARKAFEKEELDNCSFWPRINFRSQVYDKITYQPIQDRFQELQRRKFEKIANAQLRMNMGLTFKPEINQKSIQLCKQKGLEALDVAQRLSAMHLSVHLDCKVEPQKNQSTFVPEINKNTNYIIASSRQFKGSSVGFLERQKQYLQTLEEKKKSKEHGTTFDLRFRPDIGNSILILKQSHSQDVLQETPVERFRRLAYKDREQLWHARERVSEAYYAQFHFQPEIDGFSRILARNNSIDDLYKNEKGRKVKEALEQAAEYDFQQKCPFRPEVHSTTRKNDNLRLKNMIMQRRQLRKEKANFKQESRTLRELEALKECTFKPSVNPSPPLKETAPVTIKGLERHLELQCIAKQMRREQEELERKVFFSHAYSLPMRQYTIPRPFVLHTAQGRYQKRS
ncbi:hypothetical protein GOP47_0019585 [Adiantum capillus-veneris]|uniref:Uncharacterized protein n=1 Tax=Adiantum capillus-veneris TaxID=13818 RepID=A0A9D4UBS8_ADICA|nr:hypothetical protein GOP47_0019585 [Adiantum capillus-veneris]